MKASPFASSPSRKMTAPGSNVLVGISPIWRLMTCDPPYGMTRSAGNDIASRARSMIIVPLQGQRAPAASAAWMRRAIAMPSRARRARVRAGSRRGRAAGHARHLSAVRSRAEWVGGGPVGAPDGVHGADATKRDGRRRWGGVESAGGVAPPRDPEEPRLRRRAHVRAPAPAAGARTDPPRASGPSAWSCRRTIAHACASWRPISRRCGDRR